MPAKSTSSLPPSVDLALSTKPKRGRPRKTDKPPKAKANPLGKTAKFIVQKYVQPGSINWPRDMKIANTLVERYPKHEFWEMLSCTFQSPTLASLLTYKAKAYLETEWNKFNLVLPTKQEYKLENTNVGESIITIPKVKKPRTLLEFCK